MWLVASKKPTPLPFIIYPILIYTIWCIDTIDNGYVSYKKKNLNIILTLGRICHFQLTFNLEKSRLINTTMMRQQLLLLRILFSIYSRRAFRL